MGMVVTLFLALAAMVIVYAWLGQGGAVAGLIFFGVLLDRRQSSTSASRPATPRPTRPDAAAAQARVGDHLEVLGLDHQGRSPADVRPSRQPRRSAVSAASPSGPTCS